MSVIQDRNGVRTAQDIERKYNLALLEQNRKAIELQKENLTKIETINTNLLKSLIINLKDILESQSDISLWFFDGIPTLENSPSIDWDTSELKEAHIGDFYYDKQTGNVYSFSLADNSYLWAEMLDSKLIQAMALTNASIDTTDNERKVFFQQPKPEYNNGDWWIKDDFDLYICQISKDSEQIFEDNDFIIATKYTDDTLARKTDNELTVLSGSVTVIQNNVDNITQTVTQTQSILNAVNQELVNYQQTTSTQIQQVSDEINFRFIQEILPLILEGDNRSQEKLDRIERFIRFEMGHIILGEVGSNFSLEITNERIAFKQGDDAMAWFTNNELYINKAIIAKSLQVGETDRWAFEVDEAGNLNFGRVI